MKKLKTKEYQRELLGESQQKTLANIDPFTCPATILPNLGIRGRGLHISAAFVGVREYVEAGER